MLQRQQISTAPILMVGTFLFRISMVIVMITTTTIMKSVVASNNNIHHRILASAGTISSSRKRCSTTTTPIAFGSRKNNQQRHLQYNQGKLQQQQQLSDWLRDGRSIGRGANIWTNSRLYEQISSPSASPITTTKDERRMQKQQRRIARKAEHLSQITDDKKEVTTSLANDEQQRNEDDDTTTTSATGLEFEKKFDFSSNPRWDVRFQNDIHTHENFQFDSSNVQEYQKIHEKEATEDTNAARQLKQYHQAYKSLDQTIVQRAMDALRPYVQVERIERIESILRQRTQHTRFLFESKFVFYVDVCVGIYCPRIRAQKQSIVSRKRTPLFH